MQKCNVASAVLVLLLMCGNSSLSLPTEHRGKIEMLTTAQEVLRPDQKSICTQAGRDKSVPNRHLFIPHIVGSFEVEFLHTVPSANRHF